MVKIQLRALVLCLLYFISLNEQQNASAAGFVTHCALEANSSWNHVSLVKFGKPREWAPVAAWSGGELLRHADRQRSHIGIDLCVEILVSENTQRNFIRISPTGSGFVVTDPEIDERRKFGAFQESVEIAVMPRNAPTELAFERSEPETQNRLGSLTVSDSTVLGVSPSTTVTPDGATLGATGPLQRNWGKSITAPMHEFEVRTAGESAWLYQMELIRNPYTAKKAPYEWPDSILGRFAVGLSNYSCGCVWRPPALTTGKLTPVFVVVYSVPSEYTGEIEFELKSVQRMLFADLGPQAVIVPLYPRIQGAVATLTHRFRVDMKDMSAKPIFTVGSDGRRKDFFSSTFLQTPTRKND